MFGDLLYKINEQLDNEEFDSDVSTSVRKPLIGDVFIDESFKTRVRWKIDIEARSWGIKDINISVVRDISISWIEVSGEEKETEQTATVPAGLVTIETTQTGSGIYPVELEVLLDADNKVRSAVLTVAFPSK